MGNIVLLDELTINQIAAGEVIERPASVVKEMVENSIDAGATNITVEIKNGGISYIRIIDNGKGFEQDDLEIAFERHATSKIRSADDLESVTSMGFRGEALASIASIANVELLSKTAEMEIGNRIVVEAGNIVEKEEYACQKGTTITVKNLFFNTPVRYKFLRKDYTEAGYIEDAITRIALINPNVAIKLISSGKTIIQTNGSGDIKNVIYCIYGKDVAKGIINVEYTYEDYKISGVIGKPEIARSNRTNQLFFVNKRFVKDKILTAATEQAYKGIIPGGKFAFLILNIEMNPAKVDVNVHPAKLEVRFVEENRVFQAILHSIKENLLKAELVEDVSRPKEEKVSQSREYTFEQRLKEIRENKENKDIKKEKAGLFSFLKNKDEDEFKDKNSENLVENLYKFKNTNEPSNDINISRSSEENVSGNEIDIDTPQIKADIADPINTSDILFQLRQMKQKLENEITASGGEVIHTSPEAKIEETLPQNNLEEEKIEYHSQEEPTDCFDKTMIVNIPTDMIVENSEEENRVDQKTFKMDVIAEEKQLEEIENAHKIIEEINNEEVQKEFQEIKEKMQNLNDNPQIVSDDFNEMYAKMFGKLPISEKVKQEIDIDEETEIKVKDIITTAQESIFNRSEVSSYIKPYKVIGVVFKTYIILEIDGEMYILDQHAAHERIMYEKIKENYYSTIVKDSQMLLLPDVITLTHKEMDITRENMRMFTQAGFMIEEFGDNTIKLTGVPTVCFDLDTKELFLETLDEINTVARTARQEKEEKFIATVACKAAVKGNMQLNDMEIKTLLDKLLVLPNPFTCPHGRPTAIKMSKYDIERKFARK